MRRCLQLALNGEPTVSPNPMVGAVLVLEDKIIGEGWHYRTGEAHAEIKAIESVQDPALLKKATMYVSLEPCAHHGKTPPCTDRLIREGIPRVVVACRDKNSVVNGKGIEMLQKAGIEVEEGILEREATYLNRRFFTFHAKKRPFVLLKWAQTLDGYLDKLRRPGETGINWITSNDTRIFVHRQRSMCDAILVGSVTVLTDKPTLGVSELEGPDPHRLILDPRLETPEEATIFRDDNYTLFTLKKTDRRNAVTLKRDQDFLQQVLRHCYVLGIQSILVEGGAKTHRSFIEQDLWDEAYVFVGDRIFGEGVSAPRIERTAQEITDLGTDKVIRYSRL